MLLISRPNTILGEACCLRITWIRWWRMDANNGTDASVSAVYSLDEYTLLTSCLLRCVLIYTTAIRTGLWIVARVLRKIITCII
jgi:hypothetical protein